MHMHSVKWRSLRPINHLLFLNILFHPCILVLLEKVINLWPSTVPPLTSVKYTPWFPEVIKVWKSGNVHRYNGSQVRACLLWIEKRPVKRSISYCHHWERLKKNKKYDQKEGQVLCSCRIFPPVCPLTLHHWLSSFVGCICGMFWLLACISRLTPQNQSVQTRCICTLGLYPSSNIKKK